MSGEHRRPRSLPRVVEDIDRVADLASSECGRVEVEVVRPAEAFGALWISIGVEPERVERLLDGWSIPVTRALSFHTVEVEGQFLQRPQSQAIDGGGL